MTISLGVLVSGSGTTLANFIAKIDRKELDARIACVVSSRRSAGGLEKARAAGIPTAVVSRKEHADTASFSDAVSEALRGHGPDLVIMAGFLSLWTIPDDFSGRVLNIHPALVPLFSGKGYYGKRVHEAVLESGMKIGGCTVHFADNVYDHGPIVLQRAVPVRFEDTPETLAARVFEAECEAYPEAVRLYAEGRLQIEGGRVRVRNAGAPPAD